LLRWLEPENGKNDTPQDHEGVIERIKQQVRTDEQRLQVEAIAQSRTVGVWRIKRAKIIIGALEGETVQKMVTSVRVPPESILKCWKGFANLGMAYFKTPDRAPTSREARVERLLQFLEQPPSKKSIKWGRLIVRYIGHDFTARQIQQIRDLIKRNPNYTRGEIARQVCAMFQLYQSDGKYKFSQTKDIMKRMDMDNVITLPPVKKTLRSKRRSSRKKPGKLTVSFFSKPRTTVASTLSEVKHLQFIPVISKDDSVLWREMIERLHYIKTTRLFGAQLRYLVYGDETLPGTLDFLRSTNGVTDRHWSARYKDVERGKYLVAALGFAAASWRLSSRDDFIGWSDNAREANLKLVVNNVRFLILPWIKIKNLASRLLGGIVQQLPMDWEARYAYRPVLLETFVHLDRFNGTCYPAANWIQIGTTEGYSLVAKYKKKASPKGIFIYPLCRDFREQLCRF
jgi:hypothetical protein